MSSSWSLCVRTHALMVFTEQLCTIDVLFLKDHSTLLQNPVRWLYVCWSEKCAASVHFWDAYKQFSILLSKWNDADVLHLLGLSVSVPLLCLQWALLLQLDPEPCESLFIKLISPLCPCSSHANCCFLRPFATFSLTCTSARACAHTHGLAKIHKAINIAGLWTRFVGTVQLSSCRASWIWLRFSWCKAVGLVVWNKFLLRCPCKGHHWALQLDPGLREWDGWVGGRLLPSPRVSSAVFPWKTTSRWKQLVRKTLFFRFGWGLCSPHYVCVCVGVYIHKSIYI